MSRLPPSSGRFIYNSHIPVYAFEKNEGSISSTFVGRIIHRVPIQLRLLDGNIIRAVRYAGRYWPIYEPETFVRESKKWIKEGDIVYGSEYSKLDLPLHCAYLFDCDEPRGGYDW